MRGGTAVSMSSSDKRIINNNNSRSGCGSSNNKKKKKKKKKDDLCIDEIRQLQLENVEVDVQYDVDVATGRYGCVDTTVHLATHKATKAKVSLKVLPRVTTKLSDFLREFHYSYCLSAHKNVVDTYDVAFIGTSSSTILSQRIDDCYVFAREPSPCSGGNLSTAIRASDGGLPEADVKTIVRQIASALEFMHSMRLVHRDVESRNILVFSAVSDFSNVKLTEFGMTRREGTLVKKRTTCRPSCPPEIWEAVRNEGYEVGRASDVWQMAIMAYDAVTGGDVPWTRADITDPLYTEFSQWQKRKTTRTPSSFRRFTPRLLRLFRRTMDVKPDKRADVTEFYKYVENKWMMGRAGRAVSKISDGSAQQQGASGHDGKVKSKVVTTPSVGEGLMDVLNVCGIDTNVDRDTKKKRVEQWVLMSSTTTTSKT